MTFWREVRGGRVLSFTPQGAPGHAVLWLAGECEELRNRVQRAVVMCSGPFIEADDMELTNMDSLLLDGSLKAVREAAERQACGRWPASPIARGGGPHARYLPGHPHRLLDKHDLL